MREPNKEALIQALKRTKLYFSGRDVLRVFDELREAEAKDIAQRTLQTEKDLKKFVSDK